MMRKARILHDGHGNYFADYKNFRLDITESLAKIIENAAIDGYLRAEKEWRSRESDKSEQLKRYKQICELVNQDCNIMTCPQA